MVFNPLPESIQNRPYWQYGTGTHASKSRNIIGSVKLNSRTDEGYDVKICHLVIQGSSQWVVRRNVTQNCNIGRIEKNVLELLNEAGTISLRNHDLHCYVSYKIFAKDVDGTSAALFLDTAQLENSVEVHPWKELKTIVDKVHRHLCGQSNFSELKICVERSKLRDLNVDKYLARVLESFSNCITTALEKQASNETLSFMSRGLIKLLVPTTCFLKNFLCCT